MLFTDSLERLIAHRDFTLGLVHSLRFLIIWEKSALIPT